MLPCKPEEPPPAFLGAWHVQQFLQHFPCATVSWVTHCTSPGALLSTVESQLFTSAVGRFLCGVCFLLPAPCVTRGIPRAQSCHVSLEPLPAAVTPKGRLPWGPFLLWMWKLPVEASFAQAFFCDSEKGQRRLLG